MSRIGKQPVVVPAGVKVQIAPDRITIEGPKGVVSTAVPEGITVSYDEAVREVAVQRMSDARQHRASHGTIRSLVNNAVIGVSQGFTRRLEIHGLGYNASVDGRVIELNVGYSNSVRLDIPDGVEVKLPNPTLISASGPDKAVLGEFAATVRKARKPEPYKGKGIRYEGENIRRKAGKAFAGHEL